MEQILDFTAPLNIDLMEQVAACVFTPTTPDLVRRFRVSASVSASVAASLSLSVCVYLCANV